MRKTDLQARWFPALPGRPPCVPERHYEALGAAISATTFRELAARWGVSTERVRQLAAVAHRRLEAHAAPGGVCASCTPRRRLTSKERRLRDRDEMRRRLDERAKARAARDGGQQA